MAKFPITNKTGKFSNFERHSVVMKLPESLHPRFTKEFVLESVSFILENKNLNFDNKCFSLKCFILNPRNTSIQFTMEFSKDIIPFLDILIKPSNGNNDGYLSQTNRYS